MTSVCLTSQDLKSCNCLPNLCSPTILQPPHCFNLAILTPSTFGPCRELSKHYAETAAASFPSCLSPSACVSLPHLLAPTMPLPCNLLDTEHFFFPWISREIKPSSQPFIRVIMNTTGRNNQYKIRLTTANTTYRGKNSY